MEIYQKISICLLISITSMILQASAPETSAAGVSGIGAILGWGMAAIYMGGRLPQIWLNVSIIGNSVKMLPISKHELKQITCINEIKLLLVTYVIVNT